MKISIWDLRELIAAKDAWDYSRGVDHPLEKVVHIDAPVNEFPDVILRIECTILEREIITSLHGHTIWARTTRVDDIMDFKVPLSLAKQYAEKLSDIRDTMQMMSRHVSQDVYRLELPLCAMTAFTIKINFRDLVKLRDYFAYLSMHTDELQYLEHSADELNRVVKHFGSDEIVEYKNIKLLNEDPVAFTEKTQTGNFVTFQEWIPIALRAQLVRHRSVIFVDDFFQTITQPDCWLTPIKRELSFALTTTQSFMDNILSKRVCWMAQQGLWLKILDQFSDAVPPCHNGSCVYERDIRERIEGNDPGSICPRYAEAKGIELTEANEDRIMQDFNEGKAAYWNQYDRFEGEEDEE